MTKKQLNWLLVRAFGVCLLFYALTYVFAIFENLLIASGSESGKLLLGKASGLFTGWIIKTIIYSAIGIYLLINGKILYNVLDFETEDDV